MLFVARGVLAACGVLLIGLALFILVLEIIAGGSIAPTEGLSIAVSLLAALCLGAGIFFVRFAIIAGRKARSRVSSTPPPTRKDITFPFPVVMGIGFGILLAYVVIAHYFPQTISGNVTLGHLFLAGSAITLAFVKWGRSFFSAE